MTEKIVNYRFSNIESKKFTFKFDINSFNERCDRLSKRIKKLVKSNSQVYVGKFDILNYETIDCNCMNVDVIIYFKINFQYIKGLVKNQDQFLVDFHGILKDLNLKIL